MTEPRTTHAIGLGLCSAMLVVNTATAQMPLPGARLDAWLTDPQQIVPGAVMAYRQTKPETRAAIIAYLKELN